MKAKIDFPETLTEAIAYFADADRAHEFVRSIHWPDGRLSCPHCGSEAVTFMKSCRRWNCRGCKGQFSVKNGTIFEESPLGFDKWLPAFWMIVNAKNGISSCEISRALGVTQKTAWLMLHRIRYAIQDGSICKFAGNVEVDETFIGGKARSMNSEQRRSRVKGSGAVNMAPVQGLLQRNEPGKASRVAFCGIQTLRPIVQAVADRFQDTQFNLAVAGDGIVTNAMAPTPCCFKMNRERTCRLLRPDS